LYFMAALVDRHHLAAGLIGRPSTSVARRSWFAGKRMLAKVPRIMTVMPRRRRVRIESVWIDAVLDQVLPRRLSFLISNRPARGGPS